MRNSIILFLFCLVSCQSKTANTINISVDKKQGAVKITGIDIIALQGIKRDSITTEAWQSLFPVYAMPTDTGLRNYQRPVPGHYILTNSVLLFTPDTPFTGGRTYFARYYRYDRSINAIDLLLHRRVLGRGTYMELIFKY